MTIFTTTEIKEVAARTVVRINNVPFSFLTDAITVVGDQITLNAEDTAAVEDRFAKNEKNNNRRDRRQARQCAARAEARLEPARDKASSPCELIMSLAGKCGTTATRAQLGYLAALAEKAGDNFEQIGLDTNKPVSKNEISNLIDVYKREEKS